MRRLTPSPSAPVRWWLLRVGGHRDDDAPRPGEVFFNPQASVSGETLTAVSSPEQSADEQRLRRALSAVLGRLGRRPRTDSGGSLLLFDPSPFSSTPNGHASARSALTVAEDPARVAPATCSATPPIRQRGDSRSRRPRRQAHGESGQAPANPGAAARQH